MSRIKENITFFSLLLKVKTDTQFDRRRRKKNCKILKYYYFLFMFWFLTPSNSQKLTALMYVTSCNVNGALSCNVKPWMSTYHHQQDLNFLKSSPPQVRGLSFFIIFVLFFLQGSQIYKKASINKIVRSPYLVTRILWPLQPLIPYPLNRLNLY